MAEARNHLSLSEVEVLVGNITRWERIDEPYLGRRQGYKGSIGDVVIEVSHRKEVGVQGRSLCIEVFSGDPKQLLATYSKYKEFMINGSREERKLDELYFQAEEAYRAQENASKVRELVRSL